MRAGSLRHRVTLYDLVESRDAIGGVTEGWGNSRDRWASADQQSAREYLAVQGVGEEAAMKFVLRYDPTFSMTSKIEWNGSAFYPSSVRDVEGRTRTLEVVASRRRPT